MKGKHIAAAVVGLLLAGAGLAAAAVLIDTAESEEEPMSLQMELSSPGDGDDAPDELVAHTRAIVEDGEFLGHPISWAAPLPDASGIEVALDVDDATLEDLKAELQEDPDLSPVPVPVELIAEQRPQPAQ